ncbi:MAG: glycosyltransferase [Rhodovibrio sp.]|nr:glycosyltransferase [Rhodovibrio sp.]
MAKPPKVSVVIPARNEAGSVGGVVEALRQPKVVTEVIVVDNNSDDDTADVARHAGAKVIHCTEIGYGHAVKAGLRAARNNWILKCDADMSNAKPNWVTGLLDAIKPNTWMVKSFWTEGEDPLPVTNLTAKPAISRMFPKLLSLEAPLSGVYLFDLSRYAIDPLVNTYGLDLQLIVETDRNNGGIEQVNIGTMVHKIRGISHDANIAREVMDYAIDAFGADPKDRLLVVMAHADDPILWSAH